MKSQTISRQYTQLILSHLLQKLFGSFAELPRECLYGIALSFFGSALASVYYFLTIYFVDMLGMNPSSAGLVISSYGLGTICGGYIGGYLSDRMQARFVSALGLLGQSFLITNLAYIKHPYAISIDLFTLGISSYCFITSNYVAVLGHANNEKIRLTSINLLNMASNLGIGIASLTIAELSAIGYTYIFKLSGSLLLTLAIISFIRLWKANKRSTCNEIKVCIASNNAEINNSNTKEIKLALICLFFTGMVVSQLSTTYSLYLKESFPQLGVHAFSIFFTLNTLLIVLFQNALVSQFVNSNKLFMIGVGSFLIGLGMFLLNYPYSLAIIILCSFIYSSGEMIFFSMTQLFCYQSSDRYLKGRGLGTYRMVYASSRFVGPALGGAIYHYLGSTVLWTASGIIGVTFLLLCNRFKDFV